MFIASVATVRFAACRTRRVFRFGLRGACHRPDWDMPTGRPVPIQTRKGHGSMVTFGVDAHKRTHTIVAVDDRGTPLGQITVGATSKDHLGLLRWAARFGAERRWAVEDCRHLSRRLERDLLSAGECIVRVPPKLMAHVRDSARTYGKSDPIDALAVARAAQRGSSPERPVNGWPVDHAATFLRRLFLVLWVLAGGGSSPSSLRSKASWWRSRSLTDTRHQRSAARIMVA